MDVLSSMVQLGINRVYQCVDCQTSIIANFCTQCDVLPNFKDSTRGPCIGKPLHEQQQIGDEQYHAMQNWGTTARWQGSCPCVIPYIVYLTAVSLIACVIV